MTSVEQYLVIQELRRYAQAAYRHGKELAGIFLVMGSLMGLLAIFGYLSAIGRSDLFIESITVGPTLFVWLFFCLLMFLFFIVNLMMPSVILMMLVTMFDVEQEDVRSVVLRCFGMMIFGFGLLCVFVFGVIELDQFPGLMIIAGLEIVLSWILFAGNSELRNKYIKRKGNGRRNKGEGEKAGSNNKLEEARWKKLVGTLSFLALVGLAGYFGALVGIFPTLLAIWSYRGDEQVSWQIILICISAMAVSCLPAAMFLWMKGHLIKRFVGAFLGVVFCCTIFWMLSPAIFDVLTYSTAKWIGIRDGHVNKYIVSTKYPRSSFDERVWDVQGLGLKEKAFTIQAFKLYGFGSVQLLCPKGLIKVELKDWPSKSYECLALTGDKVYLAPPKDTRKKIYVPERSVDCLSMKEFAKPPLKQSGKTVCVSREIL